MATFTGTVTEDLKGSTHGAEASGQTAMVEGTYSAGQFTRDFKFTISTGIGDSGLQYGDSVTVEITAGP